MTAATTQSEAADAVASADWDRHRLDAQRPADEPEAGHQFVPQRNAWPPGVGFRARGGHLGPLYPQLGVLGAGWVSFAAGDSGRVAGLRAAGCGRQESVGCAVCGRLLARAIKVDPRPQVPPMIPRSAAMP